MTPSPELWRRICAALDRVASLDDRHPERVAEACAAEGIGVDDLTPYLDAEHASARWPEQIAPDLVEQALRTFAHETEMRPLAPGQRLGPYEIVSLLGTGGMGEVYEARDTRLDRIVAVKRLHGHLAARPDERQRFQREARAISALNHPHICTLFDIGEHEGVDYLVMELLEGETLAARLRRGALSIPDAATYGAQIADAVAAAHRRGFVHRDLKPANVMITPKGVKLLDFGLAGLRPDNYGLHDSNTEALTAKGAILGTVRYMAPEQLRGEPADARADIFALGAVLYEMVTGRRAFERGSAAQSLAAVLESDPAPVETVRSEVPRPLAWAIEQCLAKDRDRRWESAADLSRYLRDAISPRAPAVVPAKRRRYVGAALVVIAVIVAAAAAMLVMRRDTTTAMPSLARFEIQPPTGFAFDRIPALSPDGGRIAFVASRGSERALWVRAIDALTAQRLAGTDGATYPFWSPDGRFIAFFASNALKKIELATGSIETICNCDTGAGAGGAWNRDGVILFSKGLVVSPLWQVPASGGVAVALPTIPTRGETDIDRIGTNSWPQFLPDNRHFLFLTGAQGAPGVYVGLLGSADYKRILRFAQGPRASAGPDMVNVENVTERTRAWYADGFLFFLQQRSLMAQRFDIDRLELAGQPVRLVQDVEQTAPGRSIFSVAGGVLAYRPRSEERTLLRLTWLDRSGRELTSIGEASYNGIALSHDGRFVLASTGPSGVVRIDTESGIPTPLGVQGQSPVWAPGGSRFTIAGGTPNTGPFPSIVDLATREPKLLDVPLSGQAWPTDWSRDGRFIVGHMLNSETLLDLWAADVLAAPPKVRYLARAAADQQDQRISPDGHWVAYASNDRSTTPEVYVGPFLEGAGNWRISTAGGRMPLWTSDGRALLYVAPDGTLMETKVAPGVEFHSSAPQPLFRHAALARGFSRDAQFGRSYDTLDGQRFLVAVPVSEPPPAPLVVVLNWQRLLTR
jgi:eukaryotic-like serine/threonine-protein kinase